MQRPLLNLLSLYMYVLTRLFCFLLLQAELLPETGIGHILKCKIIDIIFSYFTKYSEEVAVDESAVFN